MAPTKPAPEARKGFFVVLEGPDGCGKSTQASLLVRSLRGRGRDVDHLRDPGGTAVGDRIREILLHGGALEGRTELHLFLASRAQMVGERVRPALAAGRIVVCERFTLSTVVYQGHAVSSGDTPGSIAELRELVAGAVGHLGPDALLVLDVAPEEGLRRKEAGAEGGAGLDRIEARGASFQERVRGGYRAEAAADPRAVRIPPGTVGETAARILAVVEGLLAKR